MLGQGKDASHSIRETKCKEQKKTVNVVNEMFLI